MPSVTASSVLMSDTFVSVSGVWSMYVMACRTKAWIACKQCRCKRALHALDTGTDTEAELESHKVNSEAP